MTEKNFTLNNKILFPEFPVFRRVMLVIIKFGICAPRNNDCYIFLFWYVALGLLRCMYVYMRIYIYL